MSAQALVAQQRRLNDLCRQAREVQVIGAMETLKGEQLGKQAHEHVRQHFLMPSMLLEYLDVLATVRGIRMNDLKEVS